MPTLHFIGRVVPAEPKITVSNLPSMAWDEAGLRCEYSITISNSEIDVSCNVVSYQPEQLVHLHRCAFDLARTAVNLNSFATGTGALVILDSMIDEGGNQVPLRYFDAQLPSLCRSFSTTSKFGEMYVLVSSEPALLRLLGDMIESITIPHVSSTNCGRVVDGIKHLIASPGSSDSSAWQQMRDALQVDEAFLKFITNNSKDPRHGKGTRIEGDVTSKVTARTWTVLDRFLEYRARGNEALPESEFSLLKG